jgi:fatty acid desaturase
MVSGWGALFIPFIIFFGMVAAFNILKNEAKNKSAKPVIRIFSALVAAGLACIIILICFTALMLGIMLQSGDSS